MNFCYGRFNYPVSKYNIPYLLYLHVLCWEYIKAAKINPLPLGSTEVVVGERMPTQAQQVFTCAAGCRRRQNVFIAQITHSGKSRRCFLCYGSINSLK